MESGSFGKGGASLGKAYIPKTFSPGVEASDASAGLLSLPSKDLPVCFWDSTLDALPTYGESDQARITSSRSGLCSSNGRGSDVTVMGRLEFACGVVGVVVQGDHLDLK